MIQATSVEKVDHFILCTTGIIYRDRFAPQFQVLAKIEDLLIQSNLNYTIIRHSFFMNNTDC
ncbi:hypothetical protein [Staphylococcus coagulans]|uniref:hypothetical protein n=1 Tax=Staphylococcus coagulans TaxID=74706 RepID=UPI0015FAA9C4|nr:hypothetical protein [Staphylococcus coagulans]